MVQEKDMISFKRLCLINIAATLALLFCVSAVSGQVQSNTFTSFGMKEINPANKAQSRADALSECLIDALRQYVSKNVPATMFEINQGLLKKKIFENLNTFLVNYRISEEKEEDGFYKITADVTLNTELLLDRLRALGLTQETMEKPVIALLISDIETVNGIPRESSWWTRETVPSTYAIPDRIERRLGSLGFKLMNRARFMSKLEDSKISLKNRILKGDIETIRDLGLGDILILGTSNLSMTKSAKDTVENSVTFNASVFNLRDGAKLADLEKSYDISGGKQGEANRESVSSIMDKFSADLVESFLPKWSEKANIDYIDLVATGVDSYGVYRDIKKLLLAMKPAVVDVKDASMEKGSFRWRLRIYGKISALAKRIAMEEIDGRRISVKYSSDSITIELK